jgi:hypothetical protein
MSMEIVNSSEILPASPGFLFSLLFSHEGARGIFIEKVGLFPNYTSLAPEDRTRHSFSCNNLKFNTEDTFENYC